MHIIKKYPLLLSLIATFIISVIFLLISNFNFNNSDILFYIIIYGIIMVYPFVLTIIQLFLCFVCCNNEPELFITYKFEAVTLVLGILYTPLYLLFSNISVLAPWDVVLSNSGVHSPIAPSMYLTIITMSLIGIFGYIILRAIPLNKLAPLITVFSISAIYLGCFVCLGWIIQVISNEYIYLVLLPLNCILIAIRMIKEKILEWKIVTYKSTFKYPFLQKLDQKLENSLDWPLMAFIFMIPMLGIVLMVLILFGQSPDAVIKAWTQTSDWNLSQKIAPQNIVIDQHYLCTVAAGGHCRIVKPLRKGIRHGHEVIVNRQLCIANAFEQILEEKIPKFHKRIRCFYDTYGYPFAKNINSKYIADLIYVVMKPLEYFFLLIIYLVDSKPENRIAMQYIKPLPKNNDLFIGE